MDGIVIYALIIGMPAMWLVACFLFSCFGGWAALADQYRDDRTPVGRAHYLCSGKVGWVGYNNVLVLRPSQGGLHLAVLLPFRCGHPPLFIPWSEFHATTRTQILFWTFTESDIGIPPIAHLRLPPWVADWIPDPAATA